MVQSLSQQNCDIKKRIFARRRYIISYISENKHCIKNKQEVLGSSPAITKPKKKKQILYISKRNLDCNGSKFQRKINSRFPHVIHYNLMRFYFFFIDNNLHSIHILKGNLLHGSIS